MSLAKYDYKRKKNTFGKKQSNGHEEKKTLESELERICEDKKKQREYKKHLFNQNIKSHIVYMDENGMIQENPNLHLYNEDNKTETKMIKARKKQDTKEKIIVVILFLLVIFNIFCYCYDMHMGNVIMY